MSRAVLPYVWMKKPIKIICVRFRANFPRCARRLTSAVGSWSTTTRRGTPSSRFRDRGTGMRPNSQGKCNVKSFPIFHISKCRIRMPSEDTSSMQSRCKKKTLSNYVVLHFLRKDSSSSFLELSCKKTRWKCSQLNILIDEAYSAPKAELKVNVEKGDKIFFPLLHQFCLDNLFFTYSSLRKRRSNLPELFPPD